MVTNIINSEAKRFQSAKSYSHFFCTKVALFVFLCYTDNYIFMTELQRTEQKILLIPFCFLFFYILKYKRMASKQRTIILNKYQKILRLLREASPKKKNSKCKLFPKGGGGSTPKFTFFQIDFLTNSELGLVLSVQFCRTWNTFQQKKKKKKKGKVYISRGGGQGQFGKSLHFEFCFFWEASLRGQYCKG